MTKILQTSVKNLNPQTQMEPNTEPDIFEDDTKLMKVPSSFTPEMQTESAQVSYRFRCPGPGVFQCTETGLVFGMAQEAEVKYRMVQWDESRLEGKLAAGPLFNIQCSEDAVRQLHFPHSETKDALHIDNLLSVAHFTDDGMSFLKPLEIPDTHVVVKVDHLSLFGLIMDRLKRWFSSPVHGQVLLFLRSPGRGPRTLHVLLLPSNVPVSEVAVQQGNAEYIPIFADCLLNTGWSYSLHCEQEGLEIQPERADFFSRFGPSFHPTFEVFLITNPDVVTLTVKDQDGTEVWKHDVDLKGVSDVKVEPNTEPDPGEKDPKLMKVPSSFTPETQTESAQVSYSFRCPGPGVFQCTETGLMFGMTQGAELKYSIIQWNESRLKPAGKLAAGPLFNIQCSEDAVRQLYFPHSETKDALRIDGLLSVAHFTDDEMSFLKPLEITDTHVVVEVDHLSFFGPVFDFVKKWFSSPVPPVHAQVLLFLGSPKRGPRKLHVFLLPSNVPVSEVEAKQGNAEYISNSALCLLYTDGSYSLHCEQEGLDIQPESATFYPNFGPNFHPTFEVFLTTDHDVVTLKVQDKEGTEVWKRKVYLRENVEPQSKQRAEDGNLQTTTRPPAMAETSQRGQQCPDTNMDTEQKVELQEWLKSVRTQLIDRFSDVTVNQLLDRLYEKDKIKDEEMDVVRAQTGAEKARKLIEFVKNKGPDAISVLKTALREVDKCLFDDLK